MDSNVETVIMPFSIKFTETKEGIEMEVVDDLTRRKVTIKEDIREKDFLDNNFDMFSIGRWAIETLKPRFREMVAESKKE
ncbi:MAG: hypothetical protein IPJ03_17025 [Ignavibacteriales bacterium]|nr:hypothetical protein [Ignavibacteriales bacterium]